MNTLREQAESVRKQERRDEQKRRREQKITIVRNAKLKAPEIAKNWELQVSLAASRGEFSLDIEIASSDFPYDLLLNDKTLAEAIPMACDILNGEHRKEKGFSVRWVPKSRHHATTAAEFVNEGYDSFGGTTYAGRPAYDEGYWLVRISW